MGLIAWLESKLEKRIVPSQTQDSVDTPTLPSTLITPAPVQNIEVLLKMLTSSDAAERRAAVVGLAGTGEVNVVFTPLVTVLRSDPEPEVRAAAAGALGKLGDPRAIPELTAALSDLGEVTDRETTYNWAYEGDPRGEKIKVLYRVATAARDALFRLGVNA